METRSTDISQEIAHTMQYFAYAHLPEHLARVSKPFGLLAERIAEQAPQDPETVIALRKLLETKDAAVRAALSVSVDHLKQVAERHDKR